MRRCCSGCSTSADLPNHRRIPHRLHRRAPPNPQETRAQSRSRSSSCATKPGVSPTARPAIAIDVTPLLGTRSGVGIAVAELVDALRALASAPPLVPYTLSARARMHRADAPPDTHFVPIPARFLLRSWAHADAPRIDRWLKPASVLHATNYLTPPSRLPTLVTIHDCSFVRYPELCTPEVRAFEPIVRRAAPPRRKRAHAVARRCRRCRRTVRRAPPRPTPDVRRAVGRARARVGVPHARRARAAARRRPVRARDRHARTSQELPPSRRRVRQARSRASARVPRHRRSRRPRAATRSTPRSSRCAPDTRARIVVTGSISDAERRGVLERAAVLAYPSIYEGFGFPLLEAMTVGVPVVAARAGSIPEVAGDAALLVEPTDEVGLADALESRGRRRNDAYRARSRAATTGFARSHGTTPRAACSPRIRRWPMHHESRVPHRPAVASGSRWYRTLRTRHAAITCPRTG